MVFWIHFIIIIVVVIIFLMDTIVSIIYWEHWFHSLGLCRAFTLFWQLNYCFWSGSLSHGRSVETWFWGKEITELCKRSVPSDFRKRCPSWQDQSRGAQGLGDIDRQTKMILPIYSNMSEEVGIEFIQNLCCWCL